MEENDSNIEENVVKSIEISDEIKEPHVRLIISYLGGKKLSTEDINKLKQLETTFYKIASLENGEMILNNLTGEIKEELENGTTYQVNDGVVSIGQIAKDVVLRAEKVYAEQATVEQEAYEKAFNEKKEVINTKFNADSISKMTKETFAKYEEMEKQYQEFLKTIGIKEEDRELQNKAYKDALEKAQEEGEEGEAARRVLEAKERLDKEKDTQALLEYQKAIVEHCRRELEKLKNKLKTEKIDAVSKKREFDVDEANKAFIGVKSTMFSDIEQKIEEYSQMMASAQSIIEQIERGEIGEEIALLGEDSGELQSYLEIKEQLQELESRGIRTGQEYRELKGRKTAIIEAQKVAIFDRQIEELIAKREDLLRKLDNPNLSDMTKEGIPKKVKEINDQIAIISLKKAALINKRDVAIEGEERQDDGIIKTTQYDFNNLKRNAGKVNRDLYFASIINDSYIKRDGEISQGEMQRSYFGLSTGNTPKGFDAVKIDKAITSITEDYVKSYKSIVNILKTCATQEQKILLFQELSKARAFFGKRIMELGISIDYKKELMRQFYLPDDQIDPIEYQLYLKKFGLEKVKEKFPNRTDIIERVEGNLSRLENGKEIYKDLLRTISENGEIEAVFPEIMDALYRCSSKKDHYQSFDEAQSEDEVFKALGEIYDSRTEGKEGFNDNVKKQFFELIKSVYNKHGKEGLQTIFENALVTNIYTGTFKSHLTREKIKGKYLYPLKENEKVRYDKDGGTWPDCFNMEESIEYLNVLLAMKRDRVIEKDIMNSLLQLNPEAARNAYALFELGLNKKSLNDPETNDEKKDTLRQRNKELIDMFVKQHRKKCQTISKELMARAELVDEPEKSNLTAKAGEYMNMIATVFNQIQNFDIEAVEFEFPDSERDMTLITDQAIEKGIEEGVLKAEEIQVGDIRTTDSTEKDSIVGTVSAETLRESKEAIESLPEQYIPSASAPRGTIINDMLNEISEETKETEGQKGGNISIDSIVKKTLVLGVNVIGESYEETRDIASKKQGIDKGGVSQTQVNGKKTTHTGGKER